MGLYASPAGPCSRKIRVKLLGEILGRRRWCGGDAMSLAEVAIARPIGFIMLRRAEHFPQEKCPYRARPRKSMAARKSIRKSAPPGT
jgi:glutathione S-transferase